MSRDNDDNSVLGVRLADRIAAFTRGAVGAVPYIGPIVSGLVTQLISNQRLERVKAYIVELGKRVKKVERDKLVHPRKVDLFEDGTFQAIRSLKFRFWRFSLAIGLSLVRFEVIGKSGFLDYLQWYREFLQGPRLNLDGPAAVGLPDQGEVGDGAHVGKR